MRVGSYSWYGQQCGCGAWVTPAIQVVKSKVDEAVTASPLALVGRVGVSGGAIGGGSGAYVSPALRMRGPPR